MKSVQISLNTIEKVQSFTNITSNYKFECDLVSGRYIVNAKSAMGIFSLDLSKPITLDIHADDEDCDKVINELESYLVK